MKKKETWNKNMGNIRRSISKGSHLPQDGDILRFFPLATSPPNYLLLSPSMYRIIVLESNQKALQDKSREWKVPS